VGGLSEQGGSISDLFRYLSFGGYSSRWRNPLPVYYAAGDILVLGGAADSRYRDNCD